MSSVTLYTSKGQPFIVDEADADAVRAAGPWCYCNRTSKLTYIQRMIRFAGQSKKTTQTLHRFLLAPEGLTVDHRNHDGTDNRRENLRLASQSDQARNTRPRIGKATPKGVTELGAAMDGTSRFVARIAFADRVRHIGVYSSAVDAGIAYDCAAACLFGEFAYGNGSVLPARLPVPTSTNPATPAAAFCREINAFLSGQVLTGAAS